MSTIIWGLVIIVLVLDQVSKFLILRLLNPNESLEIIKNIFCLTLVHNSGAAFGIFKNQTFFFILVSILAVVAIAVYIKKRQNLQKRPLLLRDLALGLILGGALGNLVDRLRFGHVVDFLDFKIWPVFNIADSAITIGAFLLIISLCFRHYSK